MEYCPGGELFEEIANRGKFTESDSCIILRQVLSAVKHLHDKNIAHRDLKPENILLDDKGYIKLADFGLAKLASESNSFCGTPEYISPEMLLGIGHDQAVDWWALGVLM